MSEFEQQKDYQQFHKAYQQSSNELPDEALDAAILSAAHKAVEQDKAGGIDTQPVKRAWYVPLSYVAILVISLSVVMKLAFEPVVETPFESERLRSKEKIELQMAPTASMESGAGMMADEMADITIREKPAAAPSRIAEVEERTLGKSMQSSMQPKKSVTAQSLAEEPEAILLKPSRRVTGSTDSVPAVAALSSQAVMQTEVLDDDHVSEIKELERLLQEKNFDELREKLLEYRKKYPRSSGKEHLTESLLQWEKLNMPGDVKNTPDAPTAQ